MPGVLGVSQENVQFTLDLGGIIIEDKVGFVHEQSGVMEEIWITLPELFLITNKTGTTTPGSSSPTNLAPGTASSKLPSACEWGILIEKYPESAEINMAVKPVKVILALLQSFALDLIMHDTHTLFRVKKFQGRWA